ALGRGLEGDGFDAIFAVFADAGGVGRLGPGAAWAVEPAGLVDAEERAEVANDAAVADEGGEAGLEGAEARGRGRGGRREDASAGRLLGGKIHARPSGRSRGKTRVILWTAERERPGSCRPGRNGQFRSPGQVAAGKSFGSRRWRRVRILPTSAVAATSPAVA